MIDDLIEEAQRLGERIATHERTRALREASEAVAGDREARRLQEDYARAIEVVHHAESEGRAVEPDQKRAVMTLGEAIRRSPPLQRLLKAHADFAELMDGVQRAVSGAVDEALGAGGEHEHGPGCSHGHAHGHDDDEGPAGAGDDGPRIVLP